MNKEKPDKENQFKLRAKGREKIEEENCDKELRQSLFSFNKDLPIGMQLKAINNLIRRNLDRQFATIDSMELTGIQGPAVDYIYEHSKNGDVYQKDIEKSFKIRRSTATVLLQNLENKGYIRREAVSTDARLKKIILTDKAVEKNMAIRDLFTKFNSRLENNISAEEKEVFFKVLNTIKDNLDIE